MPCEASPELTDVQLMAHLDGEADPQVAAHLETCAHCRSRAQSLAQFQGRLTARLYRMACPPPEELGEYHLGLLPADRAAPVAAHLEGCPHCRREGAQWQAFERDLAPDLQFSSRQRVRVWIGRLVEHLDGAFPPAAPALAPAYVHVRGEAEGPRLYEAGAAQIALEAQVDPQDPACKTLLGLVTGVPFSRLDAHLWRAGRPVATASVDDLGNLELRGLSPGGYELILAAPEWEIHIQELEV